MRAFKLVRKEDVSGVSGTGIVAEGAQFTDGQCVVSWFGRYHTLEIAPTLETVIQIHGHGGLTTIEWEE
jgi:hypothetical protein